MPDEKLTVSAEFDGASFKRGVDIGIATLQQFEAALRAVHKQMPTVPLAVLAPQVAAEVKDAAAAAAQYNNEIKNIVSTARSATAAVSPMAAAMSASGLASARLVQGMTESGEAAAGLTEKAHGLGPGFEVGRQGGRRLESALTAMSLAAAGVTGPLGRIVEGLVIFGAASVPLLELAATIGVVVGAYELLTTAARKAREEQKKLLESQKARLKDVGDPTGLTRTTEEDLKRIADLHKSIAAFQRAALEDARSGLPTYGEELRIKKDIAEVRRLELARAQDLATIAERERQAIFDVLQRQKEQRITSLEAAPALGTARPADQQAIRSEMALQLEIIHAQGVALVDRNEAQRTYNALLDATLFKTEQQFAATERAAQASFAQFQALGQLGSLGGALQSVQAGPGGTGTLQANIAALTAAADQAAHLAQNLTAGSAAALRLAATAKGLRDLAQAIQDAVNAASQVAGQNDRGLGLVRTQTIGARGTGSGTLAVSQQAEIQRAFAATESGIASVTVAFGDLDRHLIQTNGTWRKASREVNDHRTAAEKAADTFFHIGDATRAIGDASSALGILGQGAVSALQSVAALSDALGNLKLNPGSFSGILGVAGAGLGLAGAIGGLFGKSATEREHDQLIKQNNDRLAELRAALIDTTQQMQLAQSILSGVTNPLTAQRLGRGFGVESSDQLNAALAAAGVSLQTFAVIVKQATGIEILDSKGRLIGKAWDQARISIDLVTEAQKRQAAAAAQAQAAAEAQAAAAQAAAEAQQRQVDAIQHSIDVTNSFNQALPSLFDLRSQLTGQKDNPVVQFQNQLAILAQQLPQMAQQFAGLDISDAGGQAAIRQKILDFVNQIIAGNTFGGDIGEAGSPEFQAFIAFLTQSAGILDTFNQATAEATKSLSNVPHGVNLAALEFKAQAAGSTSGTRFGVLPGSPTRAGIGALINRIDIHVDGTGGKTPAQQAREIMKEIRRLSESTTGSPDDAGAVI